MPDHPIVRPVRPPKHSHPSPGRGTEADTCIVTEADRFSSRIRFSIRFVSAAKRSSKSAAPAELMLLNSKVMEQSSGDSVHCDPAGYEIDRTRRPGHVECVVVRAGRTELVGRASDESNQLRAVFDRVDSLRSKRRVRRNTMQINTYDVHRLVCAE